MLELRDSSSPVPSSQLWPQARALGLWRPHLPCPGHGELQPGQAHRGGQGRCPTVLLLLSAHPRPLSPSPQPVACRRSGRRCRTETLSVDVVVHVCSCAWRPHPGLAWQHALHSAPTPTPLSLVAEETHSRQPLQPLDPVGTMGSTAALQHQMDLCVRPSGHLTSPHQPVDASFLSGPRTPTGPPRFYLFRGSTLLQYLAQGPVDAAARGKPHLTVFMHVCHDRHATLPCPALSCPTLRPGSARLFKRAWAQLDLSVLGRPGLVDVSFLPACRGRAALLSASSAVDSSEDTSPSLHVAGHRDPLFCHRCRLVQSDFVNGYLLQSPPDCVTSSPKVPIPPAPQPACLHQTLSAVRIHSRNYMRPRVGSLDASSPPLEARHPCALASERTLSASPDPCLPCLPDPRPKCEVAKLLISLLGCRSPWEQTLASISIDITRQLAAHGI